MVIQYTEPLDRVFHALGDATRRGMLGLLAERGECTASELGGHFDIKQPTSSKHLRVLEGAGLVSRRVEGRSHHFRMETGPMDEARGWIERQKAFWLASFNELDDYLRDLDNKEPGNGGSP